MISFPTTSPRVDSFILGGGQAVGYGTTLDGGSANTTRPLTHD